jgi:hypothetical protein
MAEPEFIPGNRGATPVVIVVEKTELNGRSDNGARDSRKATIILYAL